MEYQHSWVITCQTYSSRSLENNGVHTFPNDICPKVNVIARLKFELACFDSTVKRLYHYAMKTPPTGCHRNTFHILNFVVELILGSDNGSSISLMSYYFLVQSDYFKLKTRVGDYCYGTQPADCNELFLLSLIPGEYSSRR